MSSKLAGPVELTCSLSNVGLMVGEVDVVGLRVMVVFTLPVKPCTLARLTVACCVLETPGVKVRYDGSTETVKSEPVTTTLTDVGWKAEGLGFAPISDMRMS
jgi:hypothetical protein